MDTGNDPNWQCDNRLHNLGAARKKLPVVIKTRVGSHLSQIVSGAERLAGG